ncbi:MAG TPA: flagellar filament capping protein FliD [Burkholderiaceae bacterium]|jgi:flagellar hook-associated protein 2
MASGSITSLGIGTNGLDLESLLSKQVAAESQPLTLLNTQTQTLQTKVSAYGQIQSTMSALQTALQGLTNPSTWGATSASSSDATAVAVAAGDGASAGNTTISVSQLATSQTIASPAVADASAAVGTGSLTIQLGQWSADNSSFTAGSAAAVTINIAAGNNSLTNIRDQINAAGAGVTASIVTDSNGSRLTMRSTATGQSAGFQVTASDNDGNGTDANGLSALAYDPSNGVNTSSLKQAAGNAKAIVNGLDIESESNTLSTVVDGLTITLNKPTTAVTLSVSQNAASIKTAITGFVSAYNAMASLFATDLKYVPNSDGKSAGNAGPLQGDSIVTGIQYMMRSLAGGTTNLGGAFSRLADIGLDPQKDGTLKVDDAKLSASLANTTDLKSFFMGVDKTTASNSGIAQQLLTFANGALSFDGQIATGTSGLNTRISQNNDRATDLQAHLDLFSSRLRDRYNALDTQMASLNSMASYVNQQMTILNANAASGN